MKSNEIPLNMVIFHRFWYVYQRVSRVKPPILTKSHGFPIELFGSRLVGVPLYASVLARVSLLVADELVGTPGPTETVGWRFALIFLQIRYGRI